MKIVDCVWEKTNLNKKVVEVNIEENDIFDEDKIKDVTAGYDYCVIKVPMNMPKFNFGLSMLGFTVIETQINISKSYKDFPFDDRLIRKVYPKASLERIDTKQGLEEILNKMTPNTFSTDRIYLDTHFVKEQSSYRYQSWVRNEYEEGISSITKIIYNGKNIGFYMERESEDGTHYGLLGGLFEEYQALGLGILTCSIVFINAHKENKPFKMMRTSISSNNIPVLQFYNYLGFKIDSMSYVFVMHNK